MDEGKYRFKLFISGMSVKSVRALENFKQIADEHLRDNHEVEIIDVGKDRRKAIEYEIFAVPTLIKFGPEPRRIILGDLSEREKVLKLLDIV
jgi:circadian clock protein KaiB